MWPLGILFLFATAAPQHSQNLPQDFQQKQSAPLIQSDSQINTCYTIRTYFFRRQDDQAPLPAGTSTCTPAKILQKRQVSRPPRALFMPLTEK
jgi:hypothetical protein